MSGMFFMGQDTWPPPCTDLDGDGYGDPASTNCINPEQDCDDDPSDDPSVCATCTCDLADCSPCAKCIHPGVSEGIHGEPLCADGVDNDCDGNIDLDDPGCWHCNSQEECDDDNPCDDG